MPAQIREVSDVVRHHHRHVGHARDLRDVGVVNPSTDETVPGGGEQEGSAAGFDPGPNSISPPSRTPVSKNALVERASYSRTASRTT